MRLFYRQPASVFTEALPLGNGRLGAMMYGQPFCETVSFNEDSFWSGYPRSFEREDAYDAWKRAQALLLQGERAQAQREAELGMTSRYAQGYLPLCTLTLEYALQGEVREYERSLEMESGLWRSGFSAAENRISKTAFVSYPAQAFVMRIEAKQPISLCARLTSPCRFSADGTEAAIHIQAPSYAPPQYLRPVKDLEYGQTPQECGMRACARLSAACDGTVTRLHGGLRIENARTVTLIFTARTSFAGVQRHPFTDGLDETRLSCQDMQAAAAQEYDALLQAHLEDFEPIMRACTLKLDLPSPERPTDEALRAYDGDPGLCQLLFAYGRYLLAACSRDGTQAANLQGIWNEQLQPPWSSNYTVNINTQMNYWPADLCNLPQTVQPLFGLIENLRKTGARTAHTHYHARGVCAHHNVDLWAQATPVGEQREGSAKWAIWPMGYAWLTRHLYEHEAYFPNAKFLAETVYPALKDAAVFFLDTLCENGKGHLAFFPAVSPENVYVLDGRNLEVDTDTAMHTSIVKEVFEHFLDVSERLGETQFTGPARRALARLTPLTVGTDGRVLEWDGEYEEPEPTHRHISHLYALYPGHGITPERTPELAQACKKTLAVRSDEGTGWSLGWKICLWARLQDGDHAHKLILRQLKPASQNDPNQRGGGTYPNLFDCHPPFQIDGNFGACAGIAELFLQNRPGQTLLLPALPGAWPSGSIHGLRAYGGYRVDIDFKNGTLARAVFTADAPHTRPIEAVYAGRSRRVDLAPGQSVVWTGR